MMKIIFLGALWGIIEASLGFVLHMSFASFTGFLLFPIGFLFMREASVSTNIKKAPLYVSLVAAGIKLVDLFIPGAVFIKVVNPAIAIVLEGMFVYMFLNNLNEESLLKTAIASFGWRMTYIAYLFILSFGGVKVRLLKAGVLEVIRYLTIDGIVNAILIFALIKIVSFKSFEINKFIAVGTLGAAFAINIII